MLPAAGGQCLPEALQGGGVPLVVAVGEVEPGDVHAGVHEGAQGLDAPAGRAEGADDLALPPGLIALCEDLVLAGGRRGGSSSSSSSSSSGCQLWDK